MTMTVHEDILAYLDGIDHAVSLPTLFGMLPARDADDIAAAARQLADEREINRVAVMTINQRYFDVFYSVRIATTTVHQEQRAPDPEPVALEFVPRLPLTPDEAVDVLARAGWIPEPEIVTIERRVADRRAPRFSVIDVIDHWKLCYRLSRVIEILGNARRNQLGANDAETIVRLVRDHVKTL